MASSQYPTGTGMQGVAGSTGPAGAAGQNAVIGVVVKTADYTLLSTDTANLFVMNSASAHTFTLPGTVPSNGWHVFLQNEGAGTATVARNGHNIDDAATNLSLTTGQGLLICSDGSNYYTSRGMGSGGGGSSTLAGDTDVSISSPANNDVLTYETSSALWKNKPASGGGGGAPASGTPFVPCPTYSTTDTGFNSYTILGCIRGRQCSYLPASWKFTIAAVGGSGISINKCTVLRTLAGALPNGNGISVIDSTAVTFGGSASHVGAFGFTPTQNNPAFVTSDAIGLQIDATHDYWICLYLDTDGTYNGSVTLPESAEAYGIGITGGYRSGDHTADTTITGINGTGDGFWSATVA